MADPERTLCDLYSQIQVTLQSPGDFDPCGFIEIPTTSPAAKLAVGIAEPVTVKSNITQVLSAALKFLIVSTAVVEIFLVPSEAL